MRAEHCQPIIDWWNNRQEIIDSENNDEKSRCFTAQQLLDIDCNFDQCKFQRKKKKFFLLQNCCPIITRNELHLNMK